MIRTLVCLFVMATGLWAQEPQSSEAAASPGWGREPHALDSETVMMAPWLEGASWSLAALALLFFALGIWSRFTKKAEAPDPAIARRALLASAARPAWPESREPAQRLAAAATWLRARAEETLGSKLSSEKVWSSSDLVAALAAEDATLSQQLEEAEALRFAPAADLEDALVLARIEDLVTAVQQRARALSFDDASHESPDAQGVST
jgi:hypothetical protein